jgi:DNA-binding transcriptional LysR family regulator
MGKHATISHLPLGSSAQLDLRHFRYFIAVAEELHFGRAARRLHMAQPPLSQQIKWLEEELGVRLLERNTHYVRLTEAGAVFLKEARRVAANAERAVRLTRQVGEGTAGRLVVGFVSQFDGGIVSMVKSALERDYPELELQFMPMDTIELVDAVRTARVRAGICGWPMDEEDFTIERLARAPLVVAMPEGHPLGERKTIRLAELGNFPLVLFPRTANPWIHGMLQRQFAAAGVNPRVVQESLSPFSMEGFVAAGAGLSILPAWVCSHRRGVMYRPLEEGELPVEVALFYLRGNDSPVLRRLREQLLAAISECTLQG